MDGRSFDRFVRLFSSAGSRRDALRAMLGTVLFGASQNYADAKRRGQGDIAGKRRRNTKDRDRNRNKGNGQRRGRKHIRAQARTGGCCSSGNCAPGPGKNLGKCCYEDAPLAGQNFKGANLGSANFRGATLANANFSSANLGKTCFVESDLTGARFAGTNSGSAIFCRTTMPDGSANNSGCDKGTNCCPTCILPCPNGQRCCGDGTCAECCSDAQCASGVCCRGTCCEDGLRCNDGQCGVCAPDCENRECGPDGCGDDCGACEAPDECNNRTGQCVCRPNCDGKQCGPDGCGGDCPPGCSGATPTCDAEGQCVQCVDSGDCPDPGPCRTRACVGNVCQPEIVPDGASPSGCDAPVGGDAFCSQGACIQRCDNNLHRICGSGAGVCQECCNEQHCNSIGGPCENGTCQCPGSSESRCGMECVSLSIEPNNCGGCGVECASGTCSNGTCRTPESCGLNCNPQHDPDCEPEICTGDKECSQALNGICTCPDGMVDCDGDGFCEACGRCGVTACPPDPETGEDGFCCPGGYCSCGGQCCAGPECWVTVITDGEGSPIGQEEHCDNESGCVNCWGECCTACFNGNCVSSGPIRGGSYRR
ncbi:MAG: pentapeptide repeat-containing protein [Thermomicrobiales bacterium]